MNGMEQETLPDLGSSTKEREEKEVERIQYNAKMITETEICIYREIYYETVKPMLISGKTQSEIDAGVTYICEEYGITKERYKFLSTLDFLQRISERGDSPNLAIKTADGEVIKLPENLPILRCPRRSEQPHENYS